MNRHSKQRVEGPRSLDALCAASESPEVPPGFADAAVQAMLRAHPLPRPLASVQGASSNRRGAPVVWLLAAICLAGSAWAMQSSSAPPRQRARYRALAQSLQAALQAALPASVPEAVPQTRPEQAAKATSLPSKPPRQRSAAWRRPLAQPTKPAAPMPPLVLPRCQCRVDLVVCSCFDD